MSSNLMYFYCPQCGKEDDRFRFKNREEEELLKTWTNVRDGYGQPIKHIKCPHCGNVLSGLMSYRECNITILGQKRYYKGVIEMYNKERRESGYIKDGELENLKRDIEDNYNKKIKKMERAKKMIALGKRHIWGCSSCGKFMKFDDYTDKPNKCEFCGDTDIV